MKSIVLSLLTTLACLSAGRARADVYNLQIPLELGEDALNSQISVWGEDQSASWQQFLLSFSTYSGNNSSIQFQVDVPNWMGSLYVANSATSITLTTSYQQLFSGTLSWTDLVLDASGSSSQLRFVIPDSRISHTFVVETEGVYVPVSLGSNQGAYIWDGQGNYNYEYFGFCIGRAFAMFPPSEISVHSWRLVDITTKEAAPSFQTNVINATWLSSYSPLIGVYAQVPDSACTYYLMTSSGSMQATWPLWDGSSYVVSGTAVVGDYIWVMREVDSATSGSAQVWNSQDGFDARATMTPYVYRNLSTWSFQVGEEVVGHNLQVVHADGYRTMFQLDPSNNWGQSFIYYWDDYGNQQQYQIYAHTAQVDVNQQTWWIEDVDTGVNYGTSYSIETSPTFAHPSPPSGQITLQIGAGRAGHDIRLIQPDGEEWRATQGQGERIYVGSYTNYGTPMERYYEIAFDYWYSPSWTMAYISDRTVGDTIPYSGADLSEWYLPKTRKNVRVHESRYFNQLRLVQPNYQEDLIKDAVRGSWQFGPSGWVFGSAGNFDAHTEAHPDAPVWVWDATRAEYLIPDDGGSGTNFLFASDNTDTDMDGLADWREHKAGTDPFDPASGPELDSDGDGLPDALELSLGSNPNNPDNPAVQLTVLGFAIP